MRVRSSVELTAVETLVVKRIAEESLEHVFLEGESIVKMGILIFGLLENRFAFLERGYRRPLFLWRAFWRTAKDL